MAETLTRYHMERYGRTSALSRGMPPDPALCAHEVSEPPHYIHQHQCSRKRGHGPEGAFCKQHAARYEEGKDG